MSREGGGRGRAEDVGRRRAILVTGCLAGSGSLLRAGEVGRVAAGGPGVRYRALLQMADWECIEALLEEHPEVRVLLDYPGVVKIRGMDPLLHVLLEAVAETQIRRHDPPEAEEAFRRLAAMGFDRHEARGAVADVLRQCVVPVVEAGGSFDREGYARRLRTLGRDMRNVGRNDPCPCGSGKKFKKCCLQAGVAVADRRAGWMLLGTGRYVLFEDPREWYDCPAYVQMENRAAIAEALEGAGDVGRALWCLQENVRCAEREEDDLALWEALFGLQELCARHAEHAETGLRVTERLLEMAGDDTDDEDMVAGLRCDRAEFLAALGRAEEAEEEFRSVLSAYPRYYGGRYRYAVFLSRIGRVADAEKELVSLLRRGLRVDSGLRQMARDFLVDIRRRKAPRADKS